MVGDEGSTVASWSSFCWPVASKALTLELNPIEDSVAGRRRRSGIVLRDEKREFVSVSLGPVDDIVEMRPSLAIGGLSG